MSSPVLLVDELKAFVEKVVQSYVLETNKADVEKPPQVAAGYLPAKKSGPDPDYPFVLARLIDNNDTRDGSTATVKIIAGTHSEDEQEGWRDPANILLRIRGELLKRRIIGGKYRLELPLKIEIPEEQAFPEWVGFMTTTWAYAQPMEEVIYE